MIVSFPDICILFTLIKQPCLLVNTIYNFKGRPWVQKWLHHMPIYLWVGWKKQLLQPVRLKPFPWFMFIDDSDIKCIHCRESLEAFLETANSFHSTIRFSAEVSNDKHVFLDTMSHLADDKVAVYLNTTDSKQYLLPTSCHPLIAARIYTVPYTLALHIRRICSADKAFEKRVKDLSENLNKRG